MTNGLVSPTTAETPQGGNLSPLLSNIYLTELDRMLESRGHKFVRYTDDCNIYGKSQRAAERVMTSCTKYLENQLKLKKHWERPSARFQNLMRLGIPRQKAREWSYSRLGYWRIADSWIFHRPLTNEYLASLGYDDLAKKIRGIALKLLNRLLN